MTVLKDMPYGIDLYEFIYNQCVSFSMLVLLKMIYLRIGRTVVASLALSILLSSQSKQRSSIFITYNLFFPHNLHMPSCSTSKSFFPLLLVTTISLSLTPTTDPSDYPLSQQYRQQQQMRQIKISKRRTPPDAKAKYIQIFVVVVVVVEAA